MSKDFYNIKAQHIEGLGYWFWQREAFSGISDAAQEICKDYLEDPPAPWRIGAWASFIFGIPAIYLLVTFAGFYIGKRYARHCIQRECTLEIYNKKNIEYFTIIEMLSGGNIGRKN